MRIEHKKEFGVYHWDTFDNETFLIHETDTLEDAIKWTEEDYGSKISPIGADQVEIVNKQGDIVKKWKVR